MELPGLGNAFRYSAVEYSLTPCHPDRRGMAAPIRHSRLEDLFSFFLFQQLDELPQKPLTSKTLRCTSSGVACEAQPQLGVADQPTHRVRQVRRPLSLHQEAIYLVLYNFRQAARRVAITGRPDKPASIAVVGRGS